MVRKIKLVLRSIVHGIRNMWRWLPIIWCDRAWDYEFMLVMLRHKLSLMEEFFRSNSALTLEHLEVAAEIGSVKICIDRLISDDYFNVAVAGCADDWGMPSMKFTARDDGLCSFVGLVFPKANNAAQQFYANEDYSLALNNAHNAKLSDWNFVWDTLQAYGREWWD